MTGTHKEMIMQEMSMQDKRVALVTGANQGVGLQVAKELVAHGLTVLVGSRNFEKGQAAAKEIGTGAYALQLGDPAPHLNTRATRSRQAAASGDRPHQRHRDRS